MPPDPTRHTRGRGLDLVDPIVFNLAQSSQADSAPTIVSSESSSVSRAVGRVGSGYAIVTIVSVADTSGPGLRRRDPLNRFVLMRGNKSH